VIDPEFEIQRPFVVSRGYPASYIESNQVKAFLGEYVVFELEIAEGEWAELRIPFEAGLDSGILKVTNEEVACVEHD
jgi:hypothetical protein